MIKPLPNSNRLLAEVCDAMRLADNQTLIVGVDGRPGSGRSSTAAWLGWQLGVPVVALALFVLPHSNPVEWRYDDLSRALSTMAGHAVVVEGVYLCQVLQALDRDPDFLVWIDEQSGPKREPDEPIDDYERAFDPTGNADFTLAWSHYSWPLDQSEKLERND